MPDSLTRWQQAVRPTPANDTAPKEAVVPPASSMPEQQPEGDEKQPTRYRLGCIELRPARGLWSLPTYAQLIDVLFDGKPTSYIALIFLHQVVIITGRHLDSIVAGLRMRTQWIIEQHVLPQPAGQPFVNEMEFITEDIPAVVARLRAGKSPPPKSPSQSPARLIG